jgi:hypothetical protein
MHGRMIARHVAEGGNPYDAFGQHINEMVEEMHTLANFVRASKNKNYDGDATHMVESAVRHYADLKAKAKRMIGRRGYHEAREQFDPAEITSVNEAVETIRELFVQHTLDPRIEQALPLLARLQEPSIKEADQFESWADKVMEGTWALPETPESVKKLQDLMSKDLIVGPDATNATEQLYDLVGDDVLFDILEDIANINPDANVWDDDRVQKRFAQLGIPMADITDQADFDNNYDAQDSDTQQVKEGSCNMTREGTECPVHGINECGMYENKTELERIRSLAAVQ